MTRLRHEVAEYSSMLRALEFRDDTPSPDTLASQFARWPEFLDKAKQPEWTLLDAVKDIAVKVIEADSVNVDGDSMGSQSGSAIETFEAEEGIGIGEAGDLNEASDGEEYISRIPPAYLDALTEQISDMLTRIFTLLACHHPGLISTSVKRFDWVAILDILSSTEIVSPTVVEGTRRRLRQIFGPEENRIPSLADESQDTGKVLPRSTRTQVSSWDLYNILNTHCSFEPVMKKKRKHDEID